MVFLMWGINLLAGGVFLGFDCFDCFDGKLFLWVNIPWLCYACD